MSRTREIKVLITENFLDCSSSAVPMIIRDEGFDTRLNGVKTFKATLIVDLPARKVTISESDFDEALEEVVRTGLFSYGSAYYSNIKAKLFKDAE